MPRISRIVACGFPHHITQRGVRSINIFHSDDERRWYLQFIKEETDRWGVEILSWCLMTNHVHFIGIPEHERSLAKAFGEAHKRYTRMKNFADNTRGYLFQGRFSSCVLNELHLIAAVRYVECNPVRAGIVEIAWDYPWSSAAYHVGHRITDVLVRDKMMLGLISDWQIFLAEAQDPSADNLRKATRTGRPAGDEDFIETMERLTGRVLRKQKPGRRSKRLY